MLFIVPSRMEKTEAKHSITKELTKIEKNNNNNQIKKLSCCKKNLACEKVSDLNCIVSCSGIFLFDCVYV